MVENEGCSLAILVAASDQSFLSYVIPHLVKACNYPFAQRTLIIDPGSPSETDKQNSSLEEGLAEVRNRCKSFLESGIVDRVVEMDYSVSQRRQIYTKYFGSDFERTHNLRGGPFLHYMYAIENAVSKDLVYFDSDMLLYQEPGYSWIEEGRELLNRRPEIIAVNPLPGPPKSDGALYQLLPYEHDPAGFYRFKSFSSRVFLIDREKFDRLLPLQIEFVRESGLSRWEVMVSNRLREAGYERADLSSPKAWTLHPVNHNANFIQALPGVIEKVEIGDFPPEQAGHYDLHLGAWMRYLNHARPAMNAAAANEIFEDYLPRKLCQSPVSPAIRARIKFNVIGEGGRVWIVDLGERSAVASQKDSVADCSVTVSARVLIDMVNGDLNPSLAVKYGWVMTEGDQAALTELIALITARKQS